MLWRNNDPYYSDSDIEAIFKKCDTIMVEAREKAEYERKMREKNEHIKRLREVGV